MSALAAALPHKSFYGCKPFYLNILLRNKDAIVAAKVAEKAGKGLLGKAAAFAANKLVTEDKIVESMAEKVIQGVSQATSELGIEAQMEIKYQQGPLVVICVHVSDVDTLQLILSAKGPEFASNFTTLMAAVTSLGMKEAVETRIDEKIASSIQEGMMTKFRELIPVKMAAQGVVVDCTVAAADQEAEIFFNIVQSIGSE